MVYLKSCFKKHIHVSVVEKSDCGIIWAKILPFNEDALFCYVYVRDPKSQVLRHEEIDFFEILEQNIAKYQNLGKTFVSGDFNAHTGQCIESTDYLTYDCHLNNGLDNNANINIPVRVSKDTVLDNYDRKLLDLCKSTGLLIGNGRLGADKHSGDITCVTNRGRSIVEYF